MAGLRTAFTRGAEGLEIRLGNRAAYYKPSVAVTSGHKTAESMLEALSRKAGLSSKAWAEPEAELFATEWRCFVSEPSVEEARELTWLRLIPKTVYSAETFHNWAKECCQFLVRHQRSHGLIEYMQDGLTGERLNEPLHAVRLSGCFYALAFYHSRLRNPEQESEVERALVLLFKALSSRLFVLDDALCALADPATRGSQKVGVTALFACGLACGALREHSGAILESFLRLFSRLRTDGGLFFSHIGEPWHDIRTAMYSSGQILLTLALLAENGSEAARALCREAFDPYCNLFRAQPTTAFIGWHIDVWSRVARLTGESHYAAFVWEQADWLVQWQKENPQWPEWRGGITRSDSEPTASTTVFVEALCCALRIALDFDESLRAARYRTVILAALPFCERLRIESISDCYRMQRERMRGGVTMSLSDARIRSDYVQHFTTMSLRLAEVADALCDSSIPASSPSSLGTKSRICHTSEHKAR